MMNRNFNNDKVFDEIERIICQQHIYNYAELVNYLHNQNRNDLLRGLRKNPGYFKHWLK